MPVRLNLHTHYWLHACVFLADAPAPAAAEEPKPDEKKKDAPKEEPKAAVKPKEAEKPADTSTADYNNIDFFRVMRETESELNDPWDAVRAEEITARARGLNTDDLPTAANFEGIDLQRLNLPESRQYTQEKAARLLPGVLEKQNVAKEVKALGRATTMSGIVLDFGTNTVTIPAALPGGLPTVINNVRFDTGYATDNLKKILDGIFTRQPLPMTKPQFEALNKAANAANTKTIVDKLTSALAINAEQDKKVREFEIAPPYAQLLDLDRVVNVYDEQNDKDGTKMQAELLRKLPSDECKSIPAHILERMKLRAPIVPTPPVAPGAPAPIIAYKDQIQQDILEGMKECILAYLQNSSISPAVRTAISNRVRGVVNPRDFKAVVEAELNIQNIEEIKRKAPDEIDVIDLLEAGEKTQLKNVIDLAPPGADLKQLVNNEFKTIVRLKIEATLVAIPAIGAILQPILTAVQADPNKSATHMTDKIKTEMKKIEEDYKKDAKKIFGSGEGKYEGLGPTAVFEEITADLQWKKYCAVVLKHLSLYNMIEKDQSNHPDLKKIKSLENIEFKNLVRKSVPSMKEQPDEQLYLDMLQDIVLDYNRKGVAHPDFSDDLFEDATGRTSGGLDIDPLPSPTGRAEEIELFGKFQGKFAKINELTIACKNLKSSYQAAVDRLSARSTSAKNVEDKTSDISANYAKQRIELNNVITDIITDLTDTDSSTRYQGVLGIGPKLSMDQFQTKLEAIKDSIPEDIKDPLPGTYAGFTSNDISNDFIVRIQKHIKKSERKQAITPADISPNMQMEEYVVQFIKRSLKKQMAKEGKVIDDDKLAKSAAVVFRQMYIANLNRKRLGAQKLDALMRREAASTVVLGLRVPKASVGYFRHLWNTSRKRIWPFRALQAAQDPDEKDRQGKPEMAVSVGTFVNTLYEEAGIDHSSLMYPLMSRRVRWHHTRFGFGDIVKAGEQEHIVTMIKHKKLTIDQCYKMYWRITLATNINIESFDPSKRAELLLLAERLQGAVNEVWKANMMFHLKQAELKDKNDVLAKHLSAQEELHEKYRAEAYSSQHDFLHKVIKNTWRYRFMNWSQEKVGKEYLHQGLWQNLIKKRLWQGAVLGGIVGAGTMLSNGGDKLKDGLQSGQDSVVNAAGATGNALVTAGKTVINVPLGLLSLPYRMIGGAGLYTIDALRGKTGEYDWGKDWNEKGWNALKYITGTHTKTDGGNQAIILFHPFQAMRPVQMKAGKA